MRQHEENEEDLPSMSLGDHLEELRSRLILALAGFVVALFASFFFGNMFVRVLMLPYEEAIRAEGLTPNVQAITVAEPFMLYIKAVIVLAMLISCPWLFYQFWSFVASGLYRNEKRYVYRVVPFSAALFILGAMFLIFIIAPMTMRFFITFDLGIKYLNYNPMISDYVNLILILSLIFGLAFQMPLMIIFAERLGLITLDSLKNTANMSCWGYLLFLRLLHPLPT